MSAETKRVLELLKEGKISSEDAEKILDKLSGAAMNQASSTGSETAPGETAGGGAGSGARKLRFLRIVVERPGHDEVNMKLPLSLARTRGLLGLVSPRITERLAERLGEKGIDLKGLAAMSEEDFAAAIESTNIDISKGNGKKVRIYCE